MHSLESRRRDEPPPPAITGIAVLCDVQGSRRLDDRARFVRRLKTTLKRVNRDIDAILGRFEFQAGLDEYAGVVRPGHLGSLLLDLWEGLHPVQVRYAIVQGTLDVVPEPDDGIAPGASGFDGPAFHRAVELLGELRRGDRLVRIECGGERQARLLTALGDLLYGRILGWTDRQAEVVHAYRHAGSQSGAATELGVDQSTVSRALSAAEYRRVLAARETFVEALDHASRSVAV